MESDATARHKILIDEWALQWTAHDMPKLIALFEKEFLYHDVPMDVKSHNATELKAFAEGFFAGFPDAGFYVKRCFVDGVFGSAEWSMRGTHSGDLPGIPRTGRSIDIPGVSYFEFSQDRIKSCSDYWDMATFLRQLGLMD